MTEFRPEDLSEFRKWNASLDQPTDVFNYVRHNVSVTAAYIMLQILSPRFIEVRGCILREAEYDASKFEEWWAECEGNTQAIESLINHQHLWDLFYGDHDDVDYRAMEEMAPLIAESWRATAAKQFPDRTFTAEVSDDYGPTVSLVSEIPRPA
jgi:hypothetical protein